MKKRIELPLAKPSYCTYHFQGANDSLYPNNNSMKNWCLNEVMNLTCDRKFLNGYSSPGVGVEKSSWHDNPFIEKITYPMQYCNGYINYIIKNLLDSQYYVYYWGIDDYYINGKSWYKTRHFSHDGLICGYDSFEKTVCICAYDINWVYRKFWVPFKSLNAGMKSTWEKEGYFGQFCGIKPKSYNVEFSPDVALKNIKIYMDSSLEKYPENENGMVYGRIVHHYVLLYFDKLIDHSILYERTDRRTLRMLWEHKSVMLERIKHIEQEKNIGTEFSNMYQSVVDKMNFARMLYASYIERRRDSLLPQIKTAINDCYNNESLILEKLLSI